MNLPALASSSCAACGRELTDPISIETGLGSDCRQQYDYVHISAVSDVVRVEAHQLIHTLAANTLVGDPLRAALFRLHEFGFHALSRRIGQRVQRKVIQLEIVPAEPPPAPPPPLPFALTDGQARALDAVTKLSRTKEHGALVVAGFAGVGKTSLLRVFSEQLGTPIVITPTGKAALRVKEATGLFASTIHRWLYKAVEDEKSGAMKFVRRTDDISIPKSKLIIVDESSMIGPDVWKDVYDTCKQRDLKLVLVGDPFQLPPVQDRKEKPFSVMTPEFAETIGAERVEMTEVLRQAQDSPVIRASMALRNGAGLHALRELQKVETHQLANICVATYQAGGVIICHRNVTRYGINAGVRMMLGITDEMPQSGEPLMVLKNEYTAGVMNGETFTFEGWKKNCAPEVFERVHDRWKSKEQDARFGGTTLDNGKITVTLALEELQGKLTEVGPKAIQIAANRWARLEGLYSADSLAPHVHANFGYCFTGHKSQGSQWPYALVCVEPSIRFDEEEGRRWVYTTITRASQMTAYHLGKV